MNLTIKFTFHFSNIKPAVSTAPVTDTGKFPSRLKFSVARPIFKKGEKNIMSNYRPSFSKILVKAIYCRLYQYLIENNILSKHQYGFRSNSSKKKKAIYKLINEFSEALNNRKITGGIFCYLHQAFDCVNHRIVLSKLEFDGIKSIFLKLINNI
jgi:hypothetical protein